MFTTSWETLGETLLTGVLAYVGLVIILRFSGKRTLSKLNAFDFVVTVALGSTLAATLTSTDVTLAQGIVAFLTIIVLQLVVAWSSIRVPLVRRAVRSRPVALVVDGRYQEEAMEAERVTTGDVVQAVRQSGSGSVADLTAVVLETDGSFSIISGGGDPSSLDALDEVIGWPAGDR